MRPMTVLLPADARLLLTAVALAAGLSGCESRAAPALTGQQVFSNYCEPCHGADGAGSQAIGAPAIAGLPQWYVQHQLENFRAGIRGTVYEDVAGMRMRPMALALEGEDQITSVARYVSVMKRSPQGTTLDGGDATKGASYYATCQACHGASGKGDEKLGAPPVAGASDWYLKRQLENFKSGVRGKHPKDTRGSQMAPMAATLPDEQAIKDVLAHVATLSR
jgi:cytochrome c oxidase subunit 2